MSAPEREKIRVWIGGKCTTGSLLVDRRGMSIKLESGEIISSNNQQVSLYEMLEQNVIGMNNTQQIHPLETPIRIKLQPHLQTLRLYSPQGGQYIEDIFPPSSLGFYGRMKSGQEKYLYIIQETSDGSKLWLTIADPSTGEIFEAHTIFPYEAEALSLIDSQEFREFWYQTIWSRVPSSDKEEILSILDSPSVSWKEFAKILGDIFVPNLQIGITMRDTLSPLIPQSFPTAVKEQLMVFLTYLLKNEIPIEDPINYLYKFWQFPILGALLEGHLMCMVDNVDWPPYLKILTLSGRKDLMAPTRAIPNAVQESPWLLFWQKTIEQFPNWANIAADIVDNLTKKGKVISKLPITEAAAKKSTASWKKRLAILVYELRILGRVNPRSLGLSKLVYLGSAYRWPHRHMEFITRLGGGGDGTPYLHVMVMPPAAAVQVKRALPNVIGVDLTVRTSNNGLFNRKKMAWEISTNRILSSLEKTNSVNKLTKRFHSENQVGSYRINQDEAKVMDLSSEGIRIAGLERKEYLAPWGFNS
ncbi:MAG: hypothetical protein MUP60_00960 [Candidatus Thorarchaeota archaeon]|nr:hypothetical protein [Candidatus Thorarchaeota archaeon]